MSAWDDATLSTLASLQNYESEIDTGGTTEKIALAKKYIGKELTLYLKQKGFQNDYQNDEKYTDMIINPDIFEESSDLYTLYLIFSDLSLGRNDEAYAEKKEDYLSRFEIQIKKDLELVEIDSNRDGNADTYGVSGTKSGSLFR